MVGRVTLSGIRPKRVWISFSTYPRQNSYKDTIKNLRISEETRVIFQGFTGLRVGKQATANAKESIGFGTKIVGGVTPGKEGEHLGLPVLPNVRKAMEELKPDATGIYVAAHQASAAIEEAIEAEVPLVVAVAEVGANSPGIISAVGKCRIGFQPLSCFMTGCVGIVAKSGTLSYEAAASTTASRLGQSLCIGIGGDVLAGTNFVDALNVFEKDEDTKGILLIGEIGGEAELEAAAWIREYKKRANNPKPIVALIGGIRAAPGRVMGHAGAFTLPGEPNALEKMKQLKEAGCIIVNHPEKFGESMKNALKISNRREQGSIGAKVHQRRNIHTARTVRTSIPNSKMLAHLYIQMRYLYLRQDFSFDLLREKGVDTSEYSGQGARRTLTISVDRATLSPCVMALVRESGQLHPKMIKIPFDYRQGFDSAKVPVLAEHLDLRVSSYRSLEKLTTSLVDLFMKYEAFLLETVFVEHSGNLKVVGAYFGFDDAAFRTSKRQSDIHALRRLTDEDASEVEAEQAGIVYIKLAGDGNIGTLVNGAVDALADAGGKAANFLDTGGKATSETVKKSFEVILKDERVKVIFVNIFGGLTLGDMIADGVLLAFKDLDMRIPVVVRIRGTNETEAKTTILESGLPLYAFDNFEEAASKAIELANMG